MLLNAADVEDRRLPLFRYKPRSLTPPRRRGWNAGSDEQRTPRHTVHVHVPLLLLLESIIVQLDTVRSIFGIPRCLLQTDSLFQPDESSTLGLRIARHAPPSYLKFHNPLCPRRYGPRMPSIPSFVPYPDFSLADRRLEQESCCRCSSLCAAWRV